MTGGAIVTRNYEDDSDARREERLESSIYDNRGSIANGKVL
jgi:hypothetical protein